MPKERLSFKAVDNAKPGEKPRKLSDGGGLYLLINPNGSKYWRYDYRHEGKRRTLALGVYPEVNLKDARVLVRKGNDPMDVKHKDKRYATSVNHMPFKKIAREWWIHQNVRRQLG